MHFIFKILALFIRYGNAGTLPELMKKKILFFCTKDSHKLSISWLSFLNIHKREE